MTAAAPTLAKPGEHLLFSKVLSHVRLGTPPIADVFDMLVEVRDARGARRGRRVWIARLLDGREARFTVRITATGRANTKDIRALDAATTALLALVTQQLDATELLAKLEALLKLDTTEGGLS